VHTGVDVVVAEQAEQPADAAGEIVVVDHHPDVPHDRVRPAALPWPELPSPERYGRHCVDTARAWAAHGRPDRAVQALLAAERHAPEEVDRPSVRDLVSGLFYAPTATPDGLRGLAGRIGVS
jgi:hypothetical protein